MKSRGTQNEIYFFWWYRRAPKIPFGAHVHIVIATNTLWVKTGTKIFSTPCHEYQHAIGYRNLLQALFASVCLPARRAPSTMRWNLSYFFWKSKNDTRAQHCATAHPRSKTMPIDIDVARAPCLLWNTFDKIHFSALLRHSTDRTSGKIYSVITLIYVSQFGSWGRKRHLSLNRGVKRVMFLSPALCFGRYYLQMISWFVLNMKVKLGAFCKFCAPKLSKVEVELFFVPKRKRSPTGDECSRCGHSTVNLLMRRKPIASTNALEENTMVLCRFPQALLGTSFIGNEIVVPGTTGSRVLARNQGTHRGSSESNKWIQIKGPDNPTRQLLPIRKDKGGGGGSRSKTKLCVTKLYVKDGVWQRQMVCVTKLCVTKLCVKDGVSKMVGDKVVRERWCVAKWCVKDGVAEDGVRQSCVWKMVWWKKVCDKVVCERWCGERWCVTKWCVKNGVWQSGVGQKWGVKDCVWQSCVWKMVCGKAVCERGCVEDVAWRRWCAKESWKRVYQRWCVKDGVWQSVWQSVWKMVRDKDGVWHHSQPNAIRATPATQNEGGCLQVPRLPRETKVDVTKCHACHAKCRGVTRDQAAPRETKVDVTKCHACHAKCRGVTRDQAGPSAPPSAMSATPATQNDRGCEIVPGLPRETNVDVTKCHACHAKCRGVTHDQAGPSAPPSAMSATPATQKLRKSHAKRPWIVPRLPRETKVDVTKRHACHAKCRGVTQDQAAPSAPPSAMSAMPAAQNDRGCEIVTRLPRETKVDVTKCHACHAKCRGVTRDQAGPSAPPSAMSATPATKTTVDVRLCHACHVKRTWMSPSATPGTQSAAASRATKRAQAGHPVPWVPRLPRKTTVDEILPHLPRETKVDVTKWHACHAKCRGVTRDQAGPSAPPSAMSATPATQNDRGCEIVPRLPRETNVDVTKCHACHAKCVRKLCVKDGMWQRWVWKIVRDKDGCERWCVTKLCVKDGMWQRWYVTDGVWKMGCVKNGVRKLCERWCVTKTDGVCDKVVCDKVVCERWCGERWCVTKLCVKDGMWQRWYVTDGVWKWCVRKLYVKDGVWQRQMVCVTKLCVTKMGVKNGVWKMVCDKVVCERWCVTKMVCDRWCVKDGVSESCVWKMVCDKDWCERWCVMVCDKVVCERLYVTKMVCDRWCVKDGVSKMACDRSCVKDGVSESCMWKMVCDKHGCEKWCVKHGMWQSCMWKMVCDKDGMWQMVCERWCVRKFGKDGVWQAGGGRREGGDPGYRIKNKNPTQSCGEWHTLKNVCQKVWYNPRYELYGLMSPNATRHQ